MKINVSLTDIVQQPDMQAVVHSVDPNMRLFSNKPGSIHYAAGPQLAAYCESLIPLSYGQSLLTPAFGMPNEYIIHSCVASFQEEPKAELILAMALESIILEVNQHQVKSLAIPALATGSLRCPPNLCASLMSKLLAYYKTEGTSLEQVRICVGTEGMLKVFNQALGSQGMV